MILDSLFLILIVGLGNPGEQYRTTRHNIGREIAAAFAREAKLPEFHFEKKWKAQVTEGKIGKEKAAVLLPDTMMNLSGSAATPAARFFKVKPRDIFIIHDDADIRLGAAKLSFGKRSAGHKGTESVMRGLKTRDFWRFRIGIAGKRNIPAEKLVLKKFAPDEQHIIKKIIKRTVDALAQAITESPERAMNEYNR